MRITKKQLQLLIREEAQRLVEEEVPAAAGEEVDGIADLRRWFVETSKALGTMKISNTQVPALKSAIEQLLASAASGSLKRRESWVEKQLEKV